VSEGVGYARLPLLGSGLSALALAVVLYALWLEARTQRRRQDRRAGFRSATASQSSSV
jgi:hypothetical protein